MLSEGCAGSFERYVSLKSRYRTSAPFAKAAKSGSVLLAVPQIVAPSATFTRVPMFRAIRQGAADQAPSAHPTLSNSLRLTSCTTSEGRRWNETVPA